MVNTLQFLLMIGSVIIIFALFMVSLYKEYYQLFLAQGVLMGLGMSFVMLPAVATVPKYFDRSRGLALGVTIGGSSLRGVIWPISLRNLFVQVGFGWGVRIAAFIMLPILVIACLTIRAAEVIDTALKAKPDFGSMKSPALILFACGLFFLFLGLFAPLLFIPSGLWSRA
jgi:MFS family permease